MSEREVIIESFAGGYMVVVDGEEMLFTRNLGKAQDAANELRETGDIGDRDEFTA